MKLIIKLIAVVPWIYISAFYSYVLRVIFESGRIPFYNNPDPSFMYLSHRNLINLSFEISFWGSIIGLIIIGIFHKRILHMKNRYLQVFFIGVIIIIYNILLDPFDTWYLD